MIIDCPLLFQQGLDTSELALNAEMYMCFSTVYRLGGSKKVHRHDYSPGIISPRDYQTQHSFHQNMMEISYGCAMSQEEEKCCKTAQSLISNIFNA